MTGSEHRTVCLALLDRQCDQMVGSRGSFKSRPGNRERTWDVMFVEVRQKMGTMETPSLETNLLDRRKKVKKEIRCVRVKLLKCLVISPTDSSGPL